MIGTFAAFMRSVRQVLAFSKAVTLDAFARDSASMRMLAWFTLCRHLFGYVAIFENLIKVRR